MLIEQNEEKIGDLLFDLMTEWYTDKIDESKDLYDYLIEKNKLKLQSIYLSYGYAGNVKYIEAKAIRLKKSKKEEIVQEIINFLDVQIVSILQFFDDEMMSEIRNISESENVYIFDKNSENEISFMTLKMLKQLCFIFCKRENDKIIIHMPDFIKNKINNIIGDLTLEYYKEIILYSKGMANVYGAISLEKAYDIIKNDIAISAEKYVSVIKFATWIELELIHYSIYEDAISNYNLDEEEIKEILNENKHIVIYEKQMYENMGDEEYLFNLNEYKEFRKFLKINYDLDINEEMMVRGEIITDYIEIAQLDENEARNFIDSTINKYFDVDDFEKNELISYIEKIREKMPIWKKGGKIGKNNTFINVVRNEKCPCRKRFEI
jgi:hypothetical protein